MRSRSRDCFGSRYVFVVERRFLLWLFLISTTGCNAPPADSIADSEELTIHKTGSAVKEAEVIVVLLHGYGAPGTDLIPIAEHLDGAGRVAFLFPEAPIELLEGGRAWNRLGGDGFEKSQKLVADLLTKLSTDHPNRPIIIGGFSQGATLSANLLDTQRCPTLHAAILFSPANLLKFPPGENQQHPKVLMSHGRDDNVLPFAQAEELRRKLEAAGVSVTWVPFNGAHTISREGLLATQTLIGDMLSEGDSAK